MPTTDQPTIDRYYQALLARDSQFNGVFYAGVKTTGVFCLATCRARKPKKENVTFYATSAEALAHGYRACKVCHPLENPGETPTYVKGLVQEISSDPTTRITDTDLRLRGVIPSKIRRWFVRNHGVTFHAYQRMVRLGVAFEKVRNGEAVTATAYEVGYESLSGFGNSFKTHFGVAPSRSQQQIIQLTRLETPLGMMVAGAVEHGVCLLEFTDRKMLETEFKALARHLNAVLLPGENRHFDVLRKELAAYFAGWQKTFSVPLVLPGTEFQRLVWHELQTIPYGITRSYGQQAAALHRPAAVRAVAGANGLNRVALLVPCHRVVGSGGELTGYGGGLWRKKWLLDLERDNA
ncbi:MAG: bifunctional transcriptional activator/DNA repair protein Ada [Hymenobacter sp.]|nr:bifunctional transcriptional activator/DNA repair protein Ada [Hymenobacter sp.]